MNIMGCPYYALTIPVQAKATLLEWNLKGWLSVIRLSFGKHGQFDITRPTALELAGLVIVLVFTIVFVLIWRLL